MSFPWVTVEINEKFEDDEEQHDDDDDDADQNDKKVNIDKEPPPKKQKFFEGEYACTRLFTASVYVGFRIPHSRPVGCFEAVLVDRPGPFFAACDAESSELQEVSTSLFGKTGTPRHPTLKADLECFHGGFLHIQVFKLDPDFRENGSSDIGLAAIALFLSLPELADWTVASYVSDARGPLTEQQRNEFELARFSSTEAADKGTKQETSYQARAAIDARQFLRAGFEDSAVEGFDSCSLLIITRAMSQRPHLSHAAALAVPLNRKRVSSFPSPAPRTAIDQTLFEALVGTCSSPEGKVLSEINVLAAQGVVDATEAARMQCIAIDSLLAQGADLDRAAALHCAVAKRFVPSVLRHLVEHGANVNSRDVRGNTPLMLAAECANSRCSGLNPLQDDTEISALLTLGADPNLQDPHGKTALGHYYMSIRNIRDFKYTFDFRGSSSAHIVVESIEAKLMPTDGATDADMLAIGDDSDDLGDSDDEGFDGF